MEKYINKTYFKKIMDETILKAIENVTNGVVISDPNQEDNPVIYVNKGFEEITEYSKEDVVGKNCRFLQGKDTDPEELDRLKKAIKERKPVRVILKNYTKKGKVFYNELYLTPQFDEKGKIKYFIGVQNDITEQVKAQKELEKYKNYLEELASERTKELSETNKKLRDEIEERQRAQEKIMNLNEKLRNYTQKLQSTIQKGKGPKFSEKEKLVLYLLTMKNLNSKSLENYYNIPPSTLTTIKNRLMEKFMERITIPDQKYLPFITLVWYLEAEKDIKDELRNNTSVVHAVCTQNAGFYILVTKDWNEYKKAQENIGLKAKKIEIRHSTKAEKYFDFSDYLKKLLQIYSDEEKNVVELKNIDDYYKKVLWGVCKYPDARLEELSKRLEISIPTISKKKRIIDETTIKFFPKISKLAKYIIIGPKLITSHLTVEDVSISLARDDLELIPEGIVIPLEENTYIKTDFAPAIKKLYLVKE